MFNLCCASDTDARKIAGEMVIPEKEPILLRVYWRNKLRTAPREDLHLDS